MGAVQCCKDADTAVVDSECFVEVQSILGHAEDPPEKPGQQLLHQGPQEPHTAIGGQRNQPAQQEARPGLEAEKQKLRALVQAFAGRAVRGAPVGLVDLQTGRIVEAIYTIDRILERITIMPRDSVACEVISHSFSLSSISEVLPATGQSDKAQPSTGILQMVGLPSTWRLEPHIADRLIVIQYNSEQRLTKTVALVEQDANSAQTFLTCLRILRLYNES